MKNLTQILDRYSNNEKNSSHFESYSLNGMVEALRILGSPDKQLKFIHVAGTNGKGSVCHMLSSIFTNAGYNTGLYTSPHLLLVNERIKLNGINIPDDVFCRTIEYIENILSGKNIFLTYFDMLTLAAIIFFAENKTDIAIIETGLGGRLDSTNVITPLVSIITDISLDHRHILGNTIEEIACEKAGIIKENIPCITTNTDTPIVSILRKKAAELSSTFFNYMETFNSYNITLTENGILFDYGMSKNNLTNIAIPFHGKFQVKNCAAVLTAVLMLTGRYPALQPESIVKALASVSVPGRMEYLNSCPIVLFDPAHNMQAIDSLIDTILYLFPDKKVH